MFEDEKINTTVKPTMQEIDVAVQVINSLAGTNGLEYFIYHLDSTTVHELQEAIIDSYHVVK